METQEEENKELNEEENAAVNEEVVTEEKVENLEEEIAPETTTEEENVTEEIASDLPEETKEGKEVIEKQEYIREGVRGKDDNVVFIGKKGIMSYVLAVVTQFNNGENEVVIKARGRAISRAVDVAEIVRQRFVKEVDSKRIDISTEEINGEEGPIKVSAIEITLAK